MRRKAAQIWQAALTPRLHRQARGNPSARAMATDGLPLSSMVRKGSRGLPAQQA
jgi:hypothetical protein